MAPAAFLEVPVSLQLPVRDEEGRGHGQGRRQRERNSLCSARPRRGLGHARNARLSRFAAGGGQAGLQAPGPAAQGAEDTVTLVQSTLPLAAPRTSVPHARPSRRQHLGNGPFRATSSQARLIRPR